MEDNRSQNYSRNLNYQEYNLSYQREQEEQEALNQFINMPIKFEPKFIELPNLRYKEKKYEFNSVDFLPKLVVENSVSKKIINYLNHEKYATQFVYGQYYKIQKIDKQKFDLLYFVNDLTCDHSTSLKEKIEQEKIYPVTVFTSSKKKDTSTIQVEEMKNQFKDCIKGISQLGNIEKSVYQKSVKEQLQSLHLQISDIDLLYMNNFRVFMTYEDLSHRSNQQQQGIKLHRYLYFPKIDFYLQPVASHSFKFVINPLITFLQKKQKNNSNHLAQQYQQQQNEQKEQDMVQFGFLTLDQNKRILLMNAGDKLATQFPLIGVWGYGINMEDGHISQKQYIWTLLVEFIKNSVIGARFCHDRRKNQFLYISFNPNSSPRFFQAEVRKNNYSNYSSIDSSCPKWTLIKNSENISVSNLQGKQFNFCYNENLEISSLDYILEKSQAEESIQNSNSGLNNSNKSRSSNKSHNMQHSFQDENNTGNSKNGINFEDSMASAAFANMSNGSGVQDYSKLKANDPNFYKELKLSKMAERMYLQQTEQIAFLQKQVTDLQQALLQQQMINQQQQAQFQQQLYQQQMQYQLQQQQSYQNSIMGTPISYKQQHQHSQSMHIQNNNLQTQIDDNNNERFNSTQQQQISNLFSTQNQNQQPLLFPQQQNDLMMQTPQQAKKPHNIYQQQQQSQLQQKQTEAQIKQNQAENQYQQQINQSQISSPQQSIVLQQHINGNNFMDNQSQISSQQIDPNLSHISNPIKNSQILQQNNIKSSQIVQNHLQSPQHNQQSLTLQQQQQQMSMEQDQINELNIYQSQIHIKKHNSSNSKGSEGHISKVIMDDDDEEQEEIRKEIGLFGENNNKQQNNSHIDLKQQQQQQQILNNNKMKIQQHRLQQQNSQNLEDQWSFAQNDFCNLQFMEEKRDQLFQQQEKQQHQQQQQQQQQQQKQQLEQREQSSLQLDHVDSHFNKNNDSLHTIQSQQTEDQSQQRNHKALNKYNIDNRDNRDRSSPLLQTKNTILKEQDNQKEKTQKPKQETSEFLRKNIFASDTEETFTMDNKGKYKLNTDFLNSNKKNDKKLGLSKNYHRQKSLNSSKNYGKNNYSSEEKEKENNKNHSNNSRHDKKQSPLTMNDFQSRSHNKIRNITSKFDNDDDDEDQDDIIERNNDYGSSLYRIPQINYKQPSGLDSDSSDDEELKMLEKRYKNGKIKI